MPISGYPFLFLQSELGFSLYLRLFLRVLGVENPHMQLDRQSVLSP